MIYIAMQITDPQNQPPNPFSSQDPYNSPTQHGYQAPPSADGFAITSMVLGIIAVLTCYFGIILGTVAVIFGHISLSKMKKDPKLGGKGMAIAGLATGYVGIAISLVFGIMFLIAANTANEFGKTFTEAFKEEFEKERIRAEKEADKEVEKEAENERSE